MNVVTPVRVLLFTTLLFAAGVSHAATLSDRTITNFIASLSELHAMEDEFAALTGDLEGAYEDDDELVMPDFEHVMSNALKDLQGQPAHNKLAGVVKQYGFSHPQQWAQAGDRIFRAWMAIEMDTQSTDISQEMKDALAELENNPDIPAAHKEQMKAMMVGAMSVMEQAGSAPQADVDAVRPHVNALRVATESDMD